MVTITASRAFRFKREKDVRAVVTGSKEVVVARGRFTALLRLDESNLAVGLESGGDPDYGPVAVVDNATTICVEFGTGKDFDGKPRQPSASVRRSVGPYGERLKGSPQVVVFGSLTKTPSNWLRTTVRVTMTSPSLTEIAAKQGTLPQSARIAGFCLS